MTQDYAVTGENGTVQMVMLEHDEHLLLLREGRGYVAAVPMPLCKHRHKRMDRAVGCGLKTAKAELERRALAPPTTEEETDALD